MSNDSEKPAPPNPGGAEPEIGDGIAATDHSAGIAMVVGRDSPLTLGASEVAAALGLSPYRPPIDLWRELTGRAAPFAGNESTIRGLVLEPYLRSEYARRHSLQVNTPAPVYRDGWMRASPDGVVVSMVEPEHWLRGLEIKTANWRSCDKWGPTGGDGDDVPLEYHVQVVWSMAVTGLLRWDVAALIGLDDYREYVVERDAAVEERMVSLASDWWQRHIVRGKEPAPDGSKQYTRHLAEKFPRISQVTLDANERGNKLASALIQTKRHLRLMKMKREFLEQELKQIIGDACGMYVRTERSDELDRLGCKPRKGRTMVDWDAVCNALIERHISPPELAQIVAAHSRQAAGSRPLLTPRVWLADLGEDDVEES